MTEEEPSAEDRRASPEPAASTPTASAAEASEPPADGPRPASAAGPAAPHAPSAGAGASAAPPTLLGRALAAPGALWASLLRVLASPPNYTNAYLLFLFAGLLIFTRSPTSNYIFDEQEAILANPYVNGTQLGFLDAFTRDFWGLPHTRSIGSYRPLPNVVWWLLWKVNHSTFFLHLINIVGHALNGAMLTMLIWRTTGRISLSWLVGWVFVTSAILTEAVTGVVGLADVMGGFGVLLALSALRLPAWAAPFGVFGGLLIGLFSKESVVVAVPLVPWCALLLLPVLTGRPRFAWLRALLVGVASVAALVLYVELRRRLFPAPLPAKLTEPLPVDASALQIAARKFMVWFAQPTLPADPINNPLVDADFAHRVVGALRIYFRGLTQSLAPLRLSGDYSFPQEPIPTTLFEPEAIAGAITMTLPPLVALGLAARVLFRREREAADAHVVLRWLAVALIWVPWAYFPHSNIPVVLPSVRAERFWYIPGMGLAVIVGLALDAVRQPRVLRESLLAVFFSMQVFQARWHAVHYTDDLWFWWATARAVPNSAKAHLNYGVILGTRPNMLEGRLKQNEIALRLAPKWPMAHVYHGDVLCHLGRGMEAFPHYLAGWELAPNDSNLIALGLQCLWDKGHIPAVKDELLEAAKRHEGSWLAYLARDIAANGTQHSGVDPQYRPRGYNQGPRE